MSKTQVLKTQPRGRKGTRHARALRAQGRIPASILSDGQSPSVEFSIATDEFLAARRHHVHLFELDLDGSIQTALIRDLQWDTFGEAVLHVEFKRVRADVETESEVELEFTGHPKAGMLNHQVTHVTVRCIPTLIPDSSEVPVGHLELGNLIYARELKLPPGVHLAIPESTPIANSVAIKIVEVAAPEAAVAAAEVVPAASPTPAPEAPRPAGREKEG